MTNIFFEIHSGLPREGPGDEASTARALDLVRGMPAKPTILDVGCGPGAQTLVLARLTGGMVTAVDNHAPFLDDLRGRAARAGLAERIQTVNASMFDMPPGYPAIGSIDENLAAIRDDGYDLAGHFVIPDSSWWDMYYVPILEKLPRLREKYRSDAEALGVLDEHDLEIDFFKRYSAYYGYVFFVMKRAD